MENIRNNPLQRLENEAYGRQEPAIETVVELMVAARPNSKSEESVGELVGQVWTVAIKEAHNWIPPINLSDEQWPDLFQQQSVKEQKSKSGCALLQGPRGLENGHGIPAKYFNGVRRICEDRRHEVGVFQLVETPKENAISTRDLANWDQRLGQILAEKVLQKFTNTVLGKKQSSFGFVAVGLTLEDVGLAGSILSRLRGNRLMTMARPGHADAEFQRPSVTLYDGELGTPFAARRDKANLHYVDVLIMGRPKLWVVVPDGAAFEAAVRLIKRKDTTCDSWVQHHNIWPKLEWLKQQGLEYSVAWQEQDQVVVISPGAYCFGFSTGHNISASQYYATEDWQWNPKTSFNFCDEEEVSHKKAGALTLGNLPSLIGDDDDTDMSDSESPPSGIPPPTPTQPDTDGSVLGTGAGENEDRVPPNAEYTSASAFAAVASTTPVSAEPYGFASPRTSAGSSTRPRSFIEPSAPALSASAFVRPSAFVGSSAGSSVSSAQRSDSSLEILASTPNTSQGRHDGGQSLFVPDYSLHGPKSHTGWASESVQQASASPSQTVHNESLAHAVSWNALTVSPSGALPLASSQEPSRSSLHSFDSLPYPQPHIDSALPLQDYGHTNQVAQSSGSRGKIRSYAKARAEIKQSSKTLQKKFLEQWESSEAKERLWKMTANYNANLKVDAKFNDKMTSTFQRYEIVLQLDGQDLDSAIKMRYQYYMMHGESMMHGERMLRWGKRAREEQRVQRRAKTWHSLVTNFGIGVLGLFKGDQTEAISFLALGLREELFTGLKRKGLEELSKEVEGIVIMILQGASNEAIRQSSVGLQHQHAFQGHAPRSGEYWLETGFAPDEWMLGQNQY